MLYLHYPLYRLFGGGLAGSEFARQVISILAYPALLVLFFRAFTRDWPRTLAWSVIVYATSIALGLYAVLTPSVSMLGVRSSMPIVATVVIRRLRASRFRGALIGIALGASLLFGTEQGAAFIAAYVIVSAIVMAHSCERRRLGVEVTQAVAVALLTLATTLVVLGGFAGLRSSLRYNFLLVAQNQFWYYGIPPNTFPATWRDVVAMMRQMPLIPVTLAEITIIATVMCRRLWRERDESLAERPDYALAMLALYGLFSCASLGGMFFHTYVHPCARVVLLITAVELDRRFVARKEWTLRLVDPRLSVAAATAVGLMFVTAPMARRAVDWTVYHVVAYHLGQPRGFELSGMWPSAITEAEHIVDAHRRPGGDPPTVWSTYSGLLEEHLGSFNPSSFDYTLHALGPENRQRYLASFRTTRPDLVQTVLPRYSDVEIWMMQTSWDFYRELLEKYQVTDTTHSSAFWERSPRANPAPAPAWSAAVPLGTSSVEIPADAWMPRDGRTRLLEVELDYVAANPLGRVPLIGAMPRYFVSARRAIARYPVSLDPHLTTGRFPVIIRGGERPTLIFQVFSLFPGARLDVRAVRVSLVPVSDANAAWFADLVHTEQARNSLGPGGDSTGLYRWR